MTARQPVMRIAPAGKSQSQSGPDLAPSARRKLSTELSNTNISLNRLRPPILRCATSWRSLRMKAPGFRPRASLRLAKLTKAGRTSGMCNQETDSGIGAWPDPDDRAGELSGSPRRHPQDRSRRAGFRAATAGSGKIPVGVAVGSLVLDAQEDRRTCRSGRHSRRHARSERRDKRAG